MAEDTSRGGRYLIVIVTGLISLGVGVGSGLLLDYLRSAPASLTYAITTSEAFAGQQARIGIVGVRIANPGRREAEGVRCSITVSGASIREHRIVGIPVADRTVRASDRELELATAFLNPGETVSLVLLLALDGEVLPRPVIDLRGKGIVGREETAAVSAVPRPREILQLSVSALAALSTVLMAILVVIPRLGFRKRHSDDQRDVLAYVLGLNGFVREAQELRATSRTVTYWATADDLTERWLKSGDKDVIQRGLAALETLLEYAQIATPSQWLIRTAMARLAVATGDLDRARRELRLAAASKHPVILKRIDYDPNLKGLGLTSGSS